MGRRSGRRRAGQTGVVGVRRPCEATIRRVLTRVDGELLDAVVGAWMRTRVGLLGGQRVIAIDGKTVRGARAAGKLAPHLVAALDHTLGVVLGLSLIHISEPTRLGMISYAVFCLKKKKKKKN